jgi:hypothetical protein
MQDENEVFESHNEDSTTPEPKSDGQHGNRNQIFNNCTVNIYEEGKAISVLGHDVFVKDIATTIRVGHTSGEIQCNKGFLELDPKAQELLVAQITELLKNIKSDLPHEEWYFDADNAALKQMMEKYPSENNSFWFLVFKSEFSKIRETKQIRDRLEKITEFLKSE